MTERAGTLLESQGGKGGKGGIGPRPGHPLGAWGAMPMPSGESGDGVRAFTHRALRNEPNGYR